MALQDDASIATPDGSTAPIPLDSPFSTQPTPTRQAVTFAPDATNEWGEPVRTALSPTPQPLELRPYDELSPDEQRQLDEEMAEEARALGEMSPAEIYNERYQDATDSIHQEDFAQRLAEQATHANPRDVESAAEVSRTADSEALSPELEAAVAHDAAIIRSELQPDPATDREDPRILASAREQQDDRERTQEGVEKTTQSGAPLRFETSTRTAEYQPGTNTVDFTDKTTSSKSELIPGEGLSGSPDTAEAVRSRTEEVFGAKIDRDEFDNSDQPLEIADREAERRASLERATALASHELRADAQVTLANKDDGIYNGKVLGVTDKYLLQRSGPASAVAHDKDIFENLPSYGRDVNVLYSGGQARVSLQPLKDKSLGIER